MAEGDERAMEPREAPAPETGEGGRGAARGSDGADGGTGDREPPDIVKRLRERRERYRERGLAYRAAWVTAAVIVIAAGLAMTVLPGPALVVIPIGLAMLSLEFAWAERLLDRALERGIDAKDMAVNASRKQKILGIAAIACAIGAVVAVAVISFL
jgi:uncharacterized protein (TIGR02611 family)